MMTAIALLLGLLRDWVCSPRQPKPSGIFLRCSAPTSSIISLTSSELMSLRGPKGGAGSSSCLRRMSSAMRAWSVSS
eukprot:4213875-Prymnesium_polylepis.1